jgi:hypothetical protein
MRGIKSSKIAPGTRSAWEPPTVTKMAIGTETKSAQEKGRSAGSEPRPPVAPAVKLGFSFEMSLPLSSRTTV